MLYICLFGLILLFITYYFIKFRNPYKMDLVVGKKGSGKSLYLAYTAKRYQGHTYVYYDDHDKWIGRLGRFKKATWQVYSSTRDIKVNGIRYFDEPEKLGDLGFPPHSFIIIDECSLIKGWDNRDFKNTNRNTLRYMRMLRHTQCRILLVSQTFDIDRKMRKLCDGLYLLTNLVVFVWIRKINKIVGINDNSMQDADSQLVDHLKFAPPFTKGAWKFLWVNRWIRYVDSYSSYLLPYFQSDLYTELKRS